MISNGRTHPANPRIAQGDSLSRWLEWAVAPGLSHLAVTPNGMAGSGTLLGSGSWTSDRGPWGGDLSSPDATSSGAYWPYPVSLNQARGEDGSGKDVSIAVLARIDSWGAGTFNKLLCVPYRTTGWTSPFATVDLGRDNNTSSGRLGVGDTGGNPSSGSSSSGYLVADGTWHLYVVTHRNTPGDSSVYFYRDGDLNSTAFLSPANPINWACNTSICLLNHSNFSTGEGTIGAVAFAAIWRRLLKPSEVRRLARDPFAVIRFASRAPWIAGSATQVYGVSGSASVILSPAASTTLVHTLSGSAAAVLTPAASSTVARPESATNALIVTPSAAGVVGHPESATSAIIVTSAASSVVSWPGSATDAVIVTPAASSVVVWPESATGAVIVAATAGAGVSRPESASSALIVTPSAASVVSWSGSASSSTIITPAASSTLSRSSAGSVALVVHPAASSVVVWPESATGAVIIHPAAGSAVVRPLAVTVPLVVSASASTHASFRRPASAPVVIHLAASLVLGHHEPAVSTVVFTPVASAVVTHVKSARVNVVFGYKVLNGFDRRASATVSLRFRAAARDRGPAAARGVNYLGRYQLGQEVPLRLEAVLEAGARTITPTDLPVVRVYRDGGFLRQVTLAADATDPARRGLFRGGYALGPTDAPGRYVAVYLYGLNGSTRAGADVWECVPGGDAAGPVIATYALGRPDGDVVLAQLGSGRLAAARGPYIDEGL